MQIEWSIKRKTDSGWDFIPLVEIAGKTLRQVYRSFIGQDVVAEFKINGQLRYFCGTEEWKKRMSKKGKAVTFLDAISLLSAVHPGLLDEVCPVPIMVAEEFPGATYWGHTETVPEPEDQQQKLPEATL